MHFYENICRILKLKVSKDLETCLQILHAILKHHTAVKMYTVTLQLFWRRIFFETSAII